MAEPFVGEIKMFAGNFAPRGWAFCDGQLLNVSQNDALFSLFGTFYGGDGRTTFGLPDMRGRVPVHRSVSPGLTNRPLGQKGGQEEVVLTSAQMPGHTHRLQAVNDAANSNAAVGNVPARPATPLYADDTAVTMSVASIGATGGSQPHENMMPFQAVHFIVSLFGIYPN